ncbi:MAG: BPSL0761 family protein [Paraburkholderia sp.]|uniref:BPSL0761 family protein n=1 Tax=Paraburkholderia sp. TaxID=1926495 RepID=UPI003C4B744B
MTKPDERTKAVLETRDFLRLLAVADEVNIPGLVQSVASGLLRHYPLDSDLAVSALALPELWALPGKSPK